MSRAPRAARFVPPAPARRRAEWLDARTISRLAATRRGDLRVVAMWGAAAILAGACGGSTDAGGNGGHAHDEGGAYAFGSPADPSDADRTIEVVASDPFSFSPRSLEVSGGETVLFHVVNEGSQLHEFVLGDEEFHDEHGGAVEHGEDTAYAVTLDPGEERDIAWTFTDDATVLYACHVDNHYESGMVGEITISS